jgi:hypothetical protein
MPKVLLRKSILLAKHNYWPNKILAKHNYWVNKISKFLLDIVFRFIIEYSSLKGFWPLGNNRSIFI